MRRQAQDAQSSGDVSFPPAVHFGDEWMALVGGSKYFARGRDEIPFVDLFDRHHCKNFVARIEERHFAIELQRFIDRQRDRYRKKLSIVQPHFRDDAIVVSLVHKPMEWTETAHCQHLEIADRAV